MRPIIVFDLDGTLTDYRDYIRRIAFPYFEKRYGKAVKPEELEPEDIFGIKEYYIKKGLSEIEAEKETKKALNRFWVSPRFVKFSLFGKFRKNASRLIKVLRKRGFQVEIHTSRSRSSDKNVAGLICRLFTFAQCYLNGIFITPKKIFFYKNDEQKVLALIQRRPLIVFDDKPKVIEKLCASGIRVVRVDVGNNITKNRRVVDIDSYVTDQVFDSMKKLIGNRNWECVEKEIKSDKFFRKLLFFVPILRNKYHPVVLKRWNTNEKSQALVYASNHVRTVDPLVIESIIKENIHWVALKRFFDGKDSIFNNSKNLLLCKITKTIFEKLVLFPVERKQDNANADNSKSLNDMNLFLRNGFNVGIFPEGTTRKKEKHFFGDFNPSFVELAKRNKADIQPILLVWVNRKKRPVLVFGDIIETDGKTHSEIFSKYMENQYKAAKKVKKWISKRIKNT